MTTPLFTYLQQTQRLIHDVRQKVINPEDLINYVNEARVQLSGESMSIRIMGALTLATGSRGPYAFTTVDLSGAPGVEGITNVNTIWYQIGDGQVWLRPRPFPWFSIYELNNPVPVNGMPKAWAQYGQGQSGTIYIGPPPIDAFPLVLDCVCYPAPLVDETTVEAIPAPWTTAIPYYAAYLALLSDQAGDHMLAAEKMLKAYSVFTDRARKFSTPSILPYQNPQMPNPFLRNQLGITERVSPGGNE